MLGRNEKTKQNPFQTSLSHREDGKPKHRRFCWRQGVVKEDCRGLAIQSHVTSFANPGRETGLSPFEECRKNHNLLFKAFWYAKVPLPSVCHQTGRRQGFAANPFGVRIQVTLGPRSECFQMTGLLGQLALGPVGNLTFSLVWVLEQSLSFLACDGKPHKQPPIPGSLYTSVVKSCCQGNEGWIAAWSIIRAARSRS